MTTHEAPVLVFREGALTRIVLNRPRVINALTHEMIEIASKAMNTAGGDGSRAILIEGAGERGLCGGADIKALVAGGPEAAAQFVQAEYELDLLTQRSTVPVVGLMDGITMGGGIGLTGHSAVRVVTERSTLAMPETKIGIVPDVGGHKLLAESPGRLGEYLAVTSSTMTGGDAVALGFADHFVVSDDLEALKRALVAGLDECQTPNEIVASFAQARPHSELVAAREWVDPLFEEVLGRDRPVSIYMASAEGHGELAQWAIAAAKHLIGKLEHSDRDEAREAAAVVRSMSPTSVAVTLAQIARTRALGLSLEEVLQDDLRILSRLFVRPDFAEGVRSVVIDKDGNANWHPRTIEDLETHEIAELLAH